MYPDEVLCLVQLGNYDSVIKQFQNADFILIVIFSAPGKSCGRRRNYFRLNECHQVNRM